MAHALRLVGDGLGFVAEMGLLAALAIWGIHIGKSAVAKTVLAVGAAAAVILVWGVFFAAGGHPVHLPRALEIAGKLAVFGTAVAALRASRRAGLATWFAVVAVASVILEYTTT